MAYLKRWRHYTAQTQSLAHSSDQELSDNETSESNHALGCQSSGEADNIQSVVQVVTSGENVPSDQAEDSDLSDQSDDSSNISIDISTTSTSDDEFHPESDDELNVADLGSELASWAAKHKCTRVAINEMLGILIKQGHRLPKDARTLMKTPRLVESEEKCGGQYKYFGIESGLTKLLAENPQYLAVDNIDLSFNVDGVPLYKSNNLQLWPILCSVGDFEPFIVAVFYGSSKPNSVGEFLSDFLAELEELCTTGLDINGREIQVYVKAFICDAPARAFLKCTKSHNAYYSCERCVIKGEWNGRVVYSIPHEDADMPELRTDDRFAENAYTEHQTARSPLIDLNISCVKTFPLDYMHLVCLGVVKRLLMFLKDGPRECKLSGQQIKIISDKLIQLRGKMPSEFARQPRSLFEIDRWKATEFRQFLLYTGPLVLSSILTKEAYEHFLTLSVAVSFLLNSNNEIRNNYLEFAKDLLKYFVRKSEHIYGNTFISYNIHSLIHIADDADNFKSSLNEISAFKFENHLHKLKKSVKNAKNPIAQIAKRAVEFDKAVKQKIFKLRFPFISTKQKDCCFLTKTGKYAFVREKRKHTFVCDVYSLRDLESFFVSPCDSKLMNICVRRNERRSKRQLLEKDDFDRKVVCLTVERGLVLLPMLHEMERR